MQTLRHTDNTTDGDTVERAGAHQRRRKTMGIAWPRHTTILALAATLLLALGTLAATAVGQLRTGSPVAIAPAWIAVAVPHTGTCRSDVAGCVPEEEFAIPASAPVAVAAPYTGTCRSDIAGCVPEEAIVPGVPAALPAPYSGPCRSDLAGCVPDEAFIPGVGAVSR